MLKWSPVQPEDNIAGPRGIVVYDSVRRLYTLNTIDNSISVFNIQNPAAPTLILQVLNVSPPVFGRALPLKRNPTPTYIRNGRSFLYGSKFGNNLNSCAVCHVDGRSDQLAWRLTPEDGILGFQNTAAGDPLSKNPSVDRFGFDFDDDTIPPPPGSSSALDLLGHMTTIDDPILDGFPDSDSAYVPPGPLKNAKGPMITQSLQGLVNYEVLADGTSLKHRFSNAPYHWRGDKQTLRSFNEAFAGLLGGSLLTESQLDKYEAFLNSIHYQPNFSEPLQRIYSGELGSPGSFGDGKNAQKGLKVFHTFGLSNFGNRSCVHCHMLPGGSDNRWPFVRMPNFGDSTLALPMRGDDAIAPINTPNLRGLRQKEARLELSSAPEIHATLRCGDFGTGSSGNRGLSVNAFEAPVPMATELKQNTVEFLREFDNGIAPIVGRTISVFPSDVLAPDGTWNPAVIPNTTRDEQLTAMQAQVEQANAGLVAWLLEDGVISQGYFYWVPSEQLPV